MKTNFMQNLSDQIVKENHRLKNEVTKLAYKVNDYEEQIIGVITAITPSVGVYENPQEMLNQFVKEFEKQRNSFEGLKKEHAKLKKVIEELRNENISALKELQRKEAAQEQKTLLWQGQKIKMNNDFKSYVDEMQRLKITLSDLKKSFDGITIQKLKIEESRRDEIEEAGLEHHIQLMTTKNKIEKEHQKIEKMLREELQTKNQTIKEMRRFVEQMKNVEGRDLRSSTFLEQIFQKLQKFNQLSEAIEELREENMILRIKKDDLQNNKASLQIKLRQSKTAEYNMQSQVQRVTIYTQDLQSRLMVKTNSLLKSEKQKEEMDKYYNTRWVQEYKRVKNRLTKQFLQKITEVQENFNEKMEGMKARMVQAVQLQSKMLKRNEYLQDIYNQDQMDKNQMQIDIKQLQFKGVELRSILKESDLMKNEETQLIKFNFQIQRIQYQKKIKQLQSMLEFNNKDIIIFKDNHQKQLLKLQQENSARLSNQKREFFVELKLIEQKHKGEIVQIEQKINKQCEDNQEMKAILQRQNEEKVLQVILEWEEKLEEKQKDNQKNHQKWVDRFRETQNQHNNSTKKLRGTIEQLNVKIEVLEENNSRLRTCRDELLQKIDKMNSQIKNQQSKIEKMEQILEQKQKRASELKQIIETFEKDLCDSRKEVEVLINMRTDWKKEISDLEYDLREQFVDLKRQNQKQKEILRQKIAELQSINRRKMINRKEYQQLEALTQQKNGLKQQVHVKEVQNVILTQIKDYYESRLKEAEHHISRVELKANHSLLSRKMKRNRLKDNKETGSHRVFEPTHRQSEEQFNDPKRYTIKSHQKHFNLSLSKAKLQEYANPNTKQFRVKTSYAF